MSKTKEELEELNIRSEILIEKIKKYHTELDQVTVLRQKALENHREAIRKGRSKNVK